MSNQEPNNVQRAIRGGNMESKPHVVSPYEIRMRLLELAEQILRHGTDEAEYDAQRVIKVAEELNVFILTKPGQ